MFVSKGILFVLLIGLLNSFATASTTLPDISPSSLKNSLRFTSWQGIEPDKWATLWLIKRHIAVDAYFLLVPPNTPLADNAIAFGVPNTAISRANRQSMFRRLKSAFDFNDPVLQYIDQIIHDVEVNIWDKPAHPHSMWFETLYRKLQARYKRDQVPIDCYLAFFDGVSRLAKKPNVSADEYSDELALTSLCPGYSDKTNEFVESIDHLLVLREISLGKNVVFIDTRESEEYDEVHLPGSKLMRLRDVNSETAQTLMSTDLVVPYCVKDFRGFEVAKSLKNLGVPRVATLSPNGLKGWLKAKLPVTKPKGLAEPQAIAALMQCAAEPLSCLEK
ncbi:MAG: chromate resistance protein [Gammaproteobacteria bacterium]|nr:chromate resistance protein [Gammaproteobacteria bacterium]